MCAYRAYGKDHPPKAVWTWGSPLPIPLLASLCSRALTLVPMMSAGMLRNSKPKTSACWTRSETATAKSWGQVRGETLVLLLALALGGSAILQRRKELHLCRKWRATQASMTIIPPEGTSHLREMTAQADAALAAIEDIEDIESIGATGPAAAVFLP